MGEKDILEKKLLMFNDVFAEFINGIMFDGKEVVKEDELTDFETDGRITINSKGRE